MQNGEARGMTILARRIVFQCLLRICASYVQPKNEKSVRLLKGMRLIAMCAINQTLQYCLWLQPVVKLIGSHIIYSILLSNNIKHLQCIGFVIPSDVIFCACYLREVGHGSKFAAVAI